MTTLYMIRHGETVGNLGARLCGVTNTVLSDKGWKQLDYLAERFRTTHIDAVYSSPLIRAFCTAQAVDRYPRLGVTLVNDLHEIDAGIWENRPWTEIRPNYPEMYEIWAHDPGRFVSVGGESMAQCYDRIVRCVTGIAEANDGRTVAVVAHGCALRNFFTFAHGWPVERCGELAYVENTSVTTVTYDSGVFRIVSEDDHSHLPDEMCTVLHQKWWNDFVVKK